MEGNKHHIQIIDDEGAPQTKIPKRGDPAALPFHPSPILDVLEEARRQTASFGQVYCRLQPVLGPIPRYEGR